MDLRLANGHFDTTLRWELNCLGVLGAVSSIRIILMGILGGQSQSL